MKRMLFFTGVSLVSSFGMVVFGAASLASKMINDMSMKLIDDLEKRDPEHEQPRQTATILYGPWKDRSKEANEEGSPQNTDPSA